MIKLRELGDGTVELPVRAQPGASRNAIIGEQDGALKIAVTAKPDKGQANAAIIKFLAKQLGIAKSQIEIRSGTTSRHKRLAITGLTPAGVQAFAALFSS